MLEVRRLRLLRELDRLGSIAAVADALSFTPSAISQQLAQLERETGVKLVERVGRGSRLTPAARVVLGQVEELLGTLDSVEAVLSQASGEPAGVVRVASFQSVAMFVLPDVIARLRVAAPRVHLQVIGADAEEALPALVAGEVDFVVFDEYAGNPRLRDARIDRDELLTERMLLALPTDHPLASASSISLRDLADESWGLPDADSLYSQTIIRLCNEHGGFSPRVDHWATDLLVLLALTEAGHALTVVPEMIQPEQKRVALRRIGHPNLTRAVLAATRSTSRASPAIRAVRTALGEALAARARDRAPRHAVERPVAL